eukprot:gene11979-16035_t
MNAQSAKDILFADGTKEEWKKYFGEFNSTSGRNKKGKCKSCGRIIPYNFTKLQEHKRGSSCTSGDKLLWVQFRREQTNNNQTSSSNNNNNKNNYNSAGRNDHGNSSNSSTISPLSGASESSALVQQRYQSTIFEDNENIAEENDLHIHERSLQRNKRLITRFLDEINPSESANLERKLAKFMFRTALPFRVLDSSAWKDFIKLARPSFQCPSAKVISTRLLDEFYDEMSADVENIIGNYKSITLVSDGWSNSRSVHIVNYLLFIPGHRPIFYEAVDTSEITQNGETIATEIIRVIEKIGVSKIVSVTTDTAPFMQSAWDIIERKYPSIFVNVCDSHVMNLLIKDIITNIQIYKETMSSTTEIVKFIKTRHQVAHEFNKIRKTLQISKGLVLPCCTRWYTTGNSAKSVLESKLAIKLLATMPVVENVKHVTERDEFIATVNSSQYWEDLEELDNVLAYPTNLMDLLECDNTNISDVYHKFQQLLNYAEANYSVEIQHIIRNHWSFINTESMSYSYLLNPQNCESFGSMTNYFDTITRLKKYITLYYSNNEQNQANCKQELINFLVSFGEMTESHKREIKKIVPYQYWAVFGRISYPLLGEIALRLYSIATSSAASERAWSVFSMLHTKRINQNNKIIKMAFVYINSSLIDSLDKHDYAHLMMQDDEEDDVEDEEDE